MESTEISEFLTNGNLTTQNRVRVFMRHDENGIVHQIAEDAIEQQF